MEIKTNGVTRTVILIGKYALKFPAIHHNYSMFIEGIRANLNEGRFVGFDCRAPIARTLYSNKFGLLNVQERARTIRHAGLFRLALCEMCMKSDFFNKDFLMDDPKPENFGYSSTGLVKLDYGN
ncbi:hypothetical protein DEG99_01935 [Salmonella enterica]|nr:hypothetical protein [Salmonella enterica]EGP0394273.1 hypothetical protein [Salmonella enterica]EHE6194720.1 hypothetical protein [Salmonella enterica]